MDEAFIYEVLSIVSEIPSGKVASYSQIARLAGRPNNARLIGRVLAVSELYGDFPCHRVVNSAGRLAPGWIAQRGLLESEGVRFLPCGRVDMAACSIS